MSTQKLYHAGGGNYLHYCPGCDGLHRINTIERNQNNAAWKFNGNMEYPTFDPSINVNSNMPSVQCHYNIVDGKIKYAVDCYHELRDKTVDLPIIPDNYL